MSLPDPVNQKRLVDAWCGRDLYPMRSRLRVLTLSLMWNWPHCCENKGRGENEAADVKEVESGVLRRVWNCGWAILVKEEGDEKVGFE